MARRCRKRTTSLRHRRSIRLVSVGRTSLANCFCEKMVGRPAGARRDSYLCVERKRVEPAFDNSELASRMWADRAWARTPAGGHHLTLDPHAIQLEQAPGRMMTSVRILLSNQLEHFLITLVTFPCD